MLAKSQPIWQHRDLRSLSRLWVSGKSWNPEPDEPETLSAQAGVEADCLHETLPTLFNAWMSAPLLWLPQHCAMPFWCFYSALAPLHSWKQAVMHLPLPQFLPCIFHVLGSLRLPGLLCSSTLLTVSHQLFSNRHHCPTHVALNIFYQAFTWSVTLISPMFSKLFVHDFASDVQFCILSILFSLPCCGTLIN